MVYLVGAGIGNSELITVRGLKCVKNADVIVYDHLADPSILSYAKDECTLVYVGKTAGKHHMSQDEINMLLVKLGEGKNVVRLKGGDPFVFGRGGEEAAELEKNNIGYEIVPGVSSSYGAAEFAGIPVTHRGIASSFHVITGHEQNGGRTVDYEVLAKLKGTLVFLMGLGNARMISENLIRNGMDAETKVAVISNAASEKQKCSLGTLKSLPSIAKKMQPPAVIIAGNVVDAGSEWFRPSDIKILATGTKHMNANIKKAFGTMPVTEIPLIKLTELNYDKVKNADLTSATHIIFTSANGVNIFFDMLKRAKRDIRLLTGKKIITAGNKTAAALSEKGLYADFIPSVHSGSEVAKSIVSEDAISVLSICAENGAKGLAEGLNKRKIPYVELPVYKTEPDPAKRELLNLCVPDMDYVIFSSGSAVRAYSKMAYSKTNAKFIAIGKETAKAALSCGIDIYKTAGDTSAESIYECIKGDIEYD